MSAFGGLVLEAHEGLRYLAADVAVRLVPRPIVTPVAGLPFPALGVALADERVAVVLGVGPFEHAPAILCEVAGERVALVGARVVAVVAKADDASELVFHDGAEVAPLDIGALFAAVETALLARPEGTSS